MTVRDLLDFDSTHLSVNRPIWSYTKVQMAYGWFRRRWAPVINKERISGLELLNIGCGPNRLEQFVNLDYWWQPGIDVCCDIRAGIPLRDSSLKGVFTEHCLEHITYDDCQLVLRDLRRVLAPGGRVRIVVPDAQLFLDLYQRQTSGEEIRFPFESEYPRGTAMLHVNRIFRDHGHLFAYDFATMKLQLEDAGFSNVTRQSFLVGESESLLVDSEYRAPESMYIEAVVGEERPA